MWERPIKPLSTNRPKESKPRLPFAVGTAANLRSHFFVLAKRLIINDIHRGRGDRPDGITYATSKSCGTSSKSMRNMD
jgi:hypothetical protein